MQTFELRADSKLDRPSPLSSKGHDVHIFQKEFQIWFPQPQDSFLLNELWPRENWDISESCENDPEWPLLSLNNQD